MPDKTTQDSSLRKERHISVPSIEDGGLEDATVASPALGYGMERVNLIDDAPDSNSQHPLSADRPSTPQEAQTPTHASWQAQAPAYESPQNDAPIGILGKHEVAAVNINPALLCKRFSLTLSLESTSTGGRTHHKEAPLAHHDSARHPPARDNHWGIRLVPLDLYAHASPRGHHEV